MRMISSGSSSSSSSGRDGGATAMSIQLSRSATVRQG